jgi:hypothetical protein
MNYLVVYLGPRVLESRVYQNEYFSCSEKLFVMI